jgi:hypothetical protein
MKPNSKKVDNLKGILLLCFVIGPHLIFKDDYSLILMIFLAEMSKLKAFPFVVAQGLHLPATVYQDVGHI